MKLSNCILLLVGNILLLVSCCKETYYQSLAGEWEVSLDRMIVPGAIDKQQVCTITLPTTTDEAGLGIPNQLSASIGKPQILYLTRKNSFVGEAWYRRKVSIPAAWKKRPIELQLERVMWKTCVWVDGKKIPETCESLVAPHRYQLTEYLTPGEHELIVCVDNRPQHDLGNMAHAYSNETQIKWNGLLGDLSLTAKSLLAIEDVRVYPDIAGKKIRVVGHVFNAGDKRYGTLYATVKLDRQNVARREITQYFQSGKNRVEFFCPVGDSVQVWDEFTPTLYELGLDVRSGSVTDSKTTRFGMRELKTEGPRLLLNGRPVFLRGTLECCVFPLTGRPPMDEAGWAKVFLSAREWGLNHLRFHSWCPPDAAFRVADSLGFYLQVELPLWPDRVGEDTAKNKFLYAEADRILAVYGNHPSFCFMSLGNELPNDFNYLAGLLAYVKKQDNRRLYTTTSFSFEKGHGDWPEKEDDYLVAQWTRNGWVRGQGVFNTEPPAFDRDFSKSVAGLPVPLITHEIGQYAVYPNLNEIEKYTGVLDPLNFKGVKMELEKKGLMNRAGEYLRASGRLAYLLYKEEIERAMKTSGCSGIQLLGLQDFPGQGTALVGLLDAFWESKGIAESSEFRMCCAPVVPLAYFPKVVYTTAETFRAGVKVANYSNKMLEGHSLVWRLDYENGDLIKTGTLTLKDVPVGMSPILDSICVPLDVVDKASALKLTVEITGTSYLNSWNLWVYPSTVNLQQGSVVVTTQWDEALWALEAGKDVLLNPPYRLCAGVEGKFVPVFWSPVHFPHQAGTMGLLIDPKHPLWKNFPTSYHTDWQWWSLTTQSRAWVVDRLQGMVTPLVECVDNFANNRRLATLLETRVGNGRLVLCSMDLQDRQYFPEKKQLLYSLLRYMQSTAFSPRKKASFEQLKRFLALPEAK